MNKLFYAALLFSLAPKIFASDHDFVYITNAAAPSSISICKIDPHTGQFETCHDNKIEMLAAPIDIALTSLNHKTYAYISNNNYPAFITRCEVGSHGNLQHCALTDVPSLTGISIHQSDKLYAYIGGSNSVQKCLLGSDGQLENKHCRDSGARNIFSNGPIYIQFQKFDKIMYAYIANGDVKPDATVVQCQVQANGDFAYCINAADTTFNGAADVDFVTLPGKTYAYITQSGGSVAKCHVNSRNGLFSDCAATTGEFHTPLGMSVKKIADKHYAYIVDGGFIEPSVNAVLQCEIDLYGDLACQDSGAGNRFANPFGITIF